MSRTQRLTFLGIALVILAVAVVALGGSSGDDGDTPAPTPTTTPAASQTPTADAAPEATATPEATPEAPLLDGSEAAELEVTQGETVRFRAISDTADHVHVHGYDIRRDLAAGKTTTISFRASIPGVFEIELEKARRPLARLKVTPE